MVILVRESTVKSRGVKEMLQKEIRAYFGENPIGKLPPRDLPRPFTFTHG